MNIGSWPARRIFWVSLLWELTLSAVIVLHVTNMFVSVGSTGSGGVGASADVGELLAMLFLIIAAPPIFIGVWVVQGNHGLVKGLKILFAVVLSFVLAFVAVAALVITWASLSGHNFSVGYGIERTR